MTTAVAAGPASRTPPRLAMRLVVNPVVREALATDGARGLGLVLPPDRAATDDELCALRRVVLLSGPGLEPR